MKGFKLLSDVSEVEVIAVGKSIRILPKLEKLYGRGRWRKVKGRALVALPDGSVSQAELHTGMKRTGLVAKT